MAARELDKEEETSHSSGRSDRSGFELGSNPGAESAAAFPDPAGRVLDHQQGPERQESVQLLPARGAVRLLPSTSHGGHRTEVQLDLRLSCQHRW